MKKTDHAWPKKVIVPTPKTFVDARGSIHPLVDVTMRSALLIHSKKGSVRANHYHKTDWHYCYVLSGSIDYHHRPVGSKAKPKVVRVKAIASCSFSVPAAHGRTRHGISRELILPDPVPQSTGPEGL